MGVKWMVYAEKNALKLMIWGLGNLHMYIFYLFLYLSVGLSACLSVYRILS